MPAKIVDICRRVASASTHEEVGDRLADFTRDARVIYLSLMAVVIGAVSALVARALVWPSPSAPALQEESWRRFEHTRGGM